MNARMSRSKSDAAVEAWAWDGSAYDVASSPSPRLFEPDLEPFFAIRLASFAGRRRNAASHAAEAPAANPPRRRDASSRASTESSPGTGTDVGSALFRRVAGTVRAAARVARPALMTMPVRQRHWMEIYESTF